MKLPKKATKRTKKAERMKLGIKGLEKLMPEGMLRNSTLLVTGYAGTGKTMLSLQYLLSGALSGEPGLYVSFEEEIPELRSIAEELGFNVKKLEDSNKLRFVKYDPFQLQDILEIIESNIKEIDAKRVVIDSASALSIHIGDYVEVRRTILQVKNILRKSGCTTIIISEIPNIHAGISRFGVEEFICDGVLLMHRLLIKGEFMPVIAVLKMRSTKHSRKIYTYEVTGKGVVVGKPAPPIDSLQKG